MKKAGSSGALLVVHVAERANNLIVHVQWKEVFKSPSAGEIMRTGVRTLLSTGDWTEPRGSAFDRIPGG